MKRAASFASHAAAAATRWPAVGRVLLSHWQKGRNRGSVALWWVVGALGLLPLVGVPGASKPHALGLALSIAAATFTGFMLLAAWVLLSFNVLQQNQPQLARLVPGHCRSLRLALWSGAGFIGLVMAALMRAIHGPALLVLMGSVALCAALVCSLRWPATALVLIVPGWTAPLWEGSAWTALVARAWTAHPAPVAVATLALAAWAMHAVVLGGGAAHRRSHARVSGVGAAFMGQAAQAQAGGRTGLRMRAAIFASQAGYAAWMRRLLAVRPTPSAPGARLALALGPQAHWTGAIGGAAFSAFFVATFAAASLVFPQWALGHAVLNGVLVGLAAAGLVLVIQLPSALWTTRREQALLTLLPGTPKGAALNRWLALRLAGVQVATTLAQGLVVSVVIAIEARAGTRLPGNTVALGMLMLSPLLMPLQWRDWSRLQAPDGRQQLLLLSVVLVFGAAAYAWVAWLQAPWWALGVVAVLLGVPWAWWRWRRLAHRPGAWPAGRLAGRGSA